jgi:putative ABC transport system permease protein
VGRTMPQDAREEAGSVVTTPLPENPSRSTRALSYMVGGVLVRQALRALAQRKGRTALTALSIAIGIAAVVWVVAIGKAGQRRAEAQLAALGQGLVWISSGSRNVSGVRTGSHAAVTLTAEDAEAILAEVPRIQSVALQSDTSVSVVSPNGNWTTRARGISVSYLDTWKWTGVALQ